MSVPFRVVPLSGERVVLAFPLIQATWPGVDLASWRSFVEAFDDRRTTKAAGVLALCDPSDSICGILAYRRDQDLGARSVLAVQLFTVVDLLNSLRAVRALLGAAETRALALGCDVIQIRLCNDQAGMASHLRALGLLPRAGLLWKKMTPGQHQN